MSAHHPLNDPRLLQDLQLLNIRKNNGAFTINNQPLYFSLLKMEFLPSATRASDAIRVFPNSITSTFASKVLGVFNNPLSVDNFRASTLYDLIMELKEMREGKVIKQKVEEMRNKK